jgi:L-cysteine desulfidase
MSVKLAMTGHSIPATTGLLGNDLNETLQIIKIISHEGMIPLDKTVLSLMIKKQEGVAGKW